MKGVSALICASMAIGAIAGSADHVSRSLVLGGEVVPKNTKTYMTGIRSTVDGNSFCGGSLISPTHVLTTTVCIGTKEPNWVSIGTHYLNGTQDGERIKVIEAKNHTAFNSTSGSYDVALLTLEKPSKFKPVKLPAANDSDIIPGMWSKLVGWGFTSVNGHKSYELLGVGLKVWDNADCAQIYPLDNSMICAGGEVGKDSCDGDTGGPLIKERGPGDADDIVIGLVSWGSECGAGYPTVFSRVSSALEWINSVMKA
ncbi:Glucanase inhibitor protein [Phytophthora megakarya]|uniref:Glucanase inhibitor protein n=1 Tax=Phytophthora megakarya TaxID=4795 RepID=A0A225UWI7_9STRA|nr:Glucanase inhibitor protein [Phytophthora megakarya]